jgi:uncharacterized membrane protein
MELWLIYTLVGYMIGAIPSALDKYMMNEQYHPVTTVLLRTMCNAIFLGTTGYLVLNMQLSSSLLLLAALPAFLLVVSFVVYLFVLQKRDASEIQPFSQSLDTMFIFLASIVFLHESASLPNYIGIIFIVIGVYLVLTEHITKIPRLDWNLWIIIALVPLDIAYALLVKTFLGDTDPIALAVSIYIMSFLILLVMSLLLRGRINNKPAFLRSQLRIVVVASLCAATAAGFLYTALAQANASKVYPMAGISSVMVFLIATMFLQEKFHKHKFLGTLIVVVGIYLISL